MKNMEFIVDIDISLTFKQLLELIMVLDNLDNRNNKDLQSLVGKTITI